MGNKTTWSLFWCLEPETQALLIWQAVQFENSEEIDKLMRQPPSHSRGEVAKDWLSYR